MIEQFHLRIRFQRQKIYKNHLIQFDLKFMLDSVIRHTF